MNLYNIKDKSEQVSFAQAVRQGLGREQGLFFPETLEPLADVDALLDLPLAERSARILSHLLGDEVPAAKVSELIDAAFTFPAPLVKLKDGTYALELFHGPTLAFKDFGGRFMAQSLTAVSDGKKITILTATSGDTGAAVAHAFYGLPNIEVVILYPKGKISPLQEKLFCTLGGNIETVAIDGDFDACQALVKQAFDDEEHDYMLDIKNTSGDERGGAEYIINKLSYEIYQQNKDIMKEERIPFPVPYGEEIIELFRRYGGLYVFNVTYQLKLTPEMTSRAESIQQFNELLLIEQQIVSDKGLLKVLFNFEDDGLHGCLLNCILIYPLQLYSNANKRFTLLSYPIH